MKKLILVCAVFLSFPLFAQDGSPDLSFGDNGLALIPINLDPPFGTMGLYGFQETSSGSILNYVSYEDTEKHIYLISVLDDGSLDLSWGTDGFLELEEINDASHDGIFLQSDHKILLKSKEEGDANRLYRYLPNGALDLNFATNGFLEFLTPSSVFNIFLENDFIFYQCTISSGVNYKIILERYSPEGVLDTSYGNNGVLEIPFGSENSPSIIKSFMLPNGSLMFFFKENEGGVNIYRVAKFTPQGISDNSYGISGVSEVIPADVDFTGYDMITNGSCYLNFSYYEWQEEIFYYKLFKLSPDGLIDSSFANQGQKDGFIAKLIQENGRVITDTPIYEWEGGYSPNFSRLYANGYLDTSFSFNTLAGDLNTTYSQILQSGKLLIGSDSMWYNPATLYLQRFSNNPLGTEDEIKPHMVLFPNPSKGIFQLNTTNPSVIHSVYHITDILGNRIQEGVVDAQDFILDLSMFESGMYFLNIDQQTYKLLKN